MTPTDTLYGSQWHFSILDNTSELLIQRIWNEFTGAGIYVGVYDTGVQINHFDLNDNYDASKEVIINGLQVSGNVVAGQIQDHGTSVAGLIAAENNGLDTVGVAFGAKITSINIFDTSSSLYINSDNAAVVDSFHSALSQGYQFDIVNHSWGGNPSFDQTQNINTAGVFSARVIDDYRGDTRFGRSLLGTIVVQAAGNENVEANGDGINASRFTITVGAIHNDGYASSYSNYGACLLVSAAAGDYNSERSGLGIVSTDRTGTDGYNLRSNASGSYNYTDDFGGTSAATPITSGVTALMLDANAGLGWRDVQNILALSADHTGSAMNGSATYSESNTWFFNDATNWNGGGEHFSEDYGYGRVNAYAAVRMAEVWTLFNAAQTSANEQSLTPSTYLANIGITDNATSTFNFNVAGSLSIEHVDLTITFSHSYFNDMRIFLVSATGTEVQLYDGLNGATNTSASTLSWTFGIDALRGELAAGTWSLRIVDTLDGDSGFLNSVRFEAFGTTPSANDTYHYTDEFVAMRAIEAGRGTLADTDGGVDWVDAAAVTGNLTLNLNAGATSTLDGTAFITIAAGTTLENAVTGDGNDFITGNSSDNSLYGMRGIDWFSDGLGADHVYGGAGNDTMVAGAGAFADSYDGGADIDTVDYSASSAGVTVNLVTGIGSGGTAAGDSYVAIENVIGSSNVTTGDFLTGGTGVNVFTGNAGNDFLDGGAGADFLFGGDNDDTIVFDANDLVANVDGGNGTDTLLVNGGVAAPVSYNLVAGHFEQARWHQTDTTNQAWATIDKNYSRTWQLMTQLTVNDIGTSSLVRFDYLANQTWTTISEFSDANNILDSRTTVLDSGASSKQYFDHLSSQTWSSIVDNFDALNRLASETTNNDAGTRTTLFLDAALANNWTTIFDSFSASNAMMTETIVYDAGNRNTQFFDHLSNQTWTSILQYFDNASHLKSESTVYDNGTRQDLFLDYLSNQAWATIIDQFHTNGALKTETTNYDTGARQVYSADYLNANSWASITDNYDTLNRLDTELVRNDNLSYSFTDYDQALTNTWASDVLVYNSAQVLTQHYRVMDNGSIVVL